MGYRRATKWMCHKAMEQYRWFQDEGYSDWDMWMGIRDAYPESLTKITKDGLIQLMAEISAGFGSPFTPTGRTCIKCLKEFGCKWMGEWVCKTCREE